MSVAREPVRFNEQDDSRTTIAKLNRLVDELYNKLAVAELRVTQAATLDGSLTANGSVTIPTGAVNGYRWTCDADGIGSWALVADSTPGGSDGQVQYNSTCAFAGDAGLTYDPATDTLTVDGDIVGVNNITTSNDVTVGAELDCVTLDVSGNGDIAGTTDLHDTLTMRDNASIVITGTGQFYLKDQTVPITATSEGTQGRIAFDGTHIYYCSASNVWVRAQMNTW
jgi:phage baseplate assembly protein gpV